MKTRFRRRFLALTCLGVMAVHAAVLGALPAWMPALPHAASPDDGAWVFETRTVQEAPARTTAPQRRPIAAPRKLVAPATPPSASPAQDTPDAPQAAATPEPSAPQEEGTVLAAASTPPAPPAPNTAPKTAAVAVATPKITPPASVRLKYDVRGEVKGFAYFVYGDLTWLNEGGSYTAKLEISHFLLGSRIQTSKGLITDQGLAPVRFGDKVRSEVAAHFDRAQNRVTYSANTPSEALAPGAQDQLSVFFQIAALLAATPDHYPPGSTLRFQTIGPKHSENWAFDVAATESLSLPGGQVNAVKLTKAPVGEYDSRAEVWLAPTLGYLPVRIRLTQGNGDVVDQLWRATERPATTTP
jgi:hypothetical protein